MRKSEFIFTISMLLLSTLNSCKKDSTDFNQNENLLIKQSWILVSNRQNTNNNGWVDIFSGFPACQRDNRFFFKPDYSFNWDEGLTKCNTSDPQTFYFGTWSLLSNETKLSTSFGGVTTERDIFLLDNSNLITIRKHISGTDTTVTEAKYIH